MGLSEEALVAHNKYRQIHGAPPLRLNSDLEAKAQSWAQSLAKKGYLQHANQSEEGENIACLKGAELTGAKATEMWYEEIKDYDFNRPGFNSKTGHFTQVVWTKSVEFGIGKATASNGMEFVVARYFPPGNMIKSFPENVKPRGFKISPNNTENNNTWTDNNNSNMTRTTTNDNIHTTTPSLNDNKKDDRKKHPVRESEKNFQFNLLRAHNAYRKRHGAGILVWNSKLAKIAEEASEDAARTNTLRSVDINKVGQNMAAMTGGELTGERVTSMWYDEEQKYNYDEPGFSSSTGSFTQLVWQGTKEIGVGRSFGPEGQTFVIALYSPPGNIKGKYDANVSRPTGPIPIIKTDRNDTKGQCCTIL